MNVRHTKSNCRNFYFFKSLFTLLVAVMLASSLQAKTDSSDADSSGPWLASIQAGFSGVSGNANDSTYTGQINLGYKTKNWKHTAEITALYTYSEDITSAEEGTAVIESRRFFKKNNFLFIRNNVMYDKFGVYRILNNTSLGYGHEFLNSDKLQLSIQLGPGYRTAEINGEGRHISVLTSNALLDFNWDITDKLSFEQKLSVSRSEEEDISQNTVTTSQTSLNSRVSKALALQSSFEVLNNSVITEDSYATKHTDYRTLFSVIYTL